MDQGGCAPKLDLVLLSGLLCDESMWTDIAARLNDVAQSHIFCFPNLSSIEDMADLVLRGAPPRFVLVGHSMGGRVALEIVKRSPERVRALGLFNTGTHLPTESEPESRGRLVELARTSGMSALAKAWLPPMMNEGHLPSGALAKQLTDMVERSTPANFEAQISALLHRPDADSVLPLVRVPTLLMSATGDRWSPVEQHEAVRKHIPDADLVVIEDAGHMAPVEQSASVAQAMRRWLQSLGSENLDDVQQLAIEARCIRQINHYARLSDAGQFEKLARLYTEDGVFARPTDPGVQIRGREAILTSHLARPARTTRHVMAGIDVRVESSTRVRASSVVLLFAGQNGPRPAQLSATLVGTFDDVLENVDGEWLFAQRLGAVDIKD